MHKKNIELLLQAILLRYLGRRHDGDCNSTSTYQIYFVLELLFSKQETKNYSHTGASKYYKKIFNTLLGLPYAFPIKIVSWKPTATESVRIIRIQFISGIQICPLTFFEVWTILTRGKQPSAFNCLTIENVAVMMDWLPTMLARVAMTKTGQYTLSA